MNQPASSPLAGAPGRQLGPPRRGPVEHPVDLLPLPLSMAPAPCRRSRRRVTDPHLAELALALHQLVVAGAFAHYDPGEAPSNTCPVSSVPTRPGTPRGADVVVRRDQRRGLPPSSRLTRGHPFSSQIPRPLALGRWSRWKLTLSLPLWQTSSSETSALGGDDVHSPRPAGGGPARRLRQRLDGHRRSGADFSHDRAPPAGRGDLPALSRRWPRSRDDRLRPPPPPPAHPPVAAQPAAFVPSHELNESASRRKVVYAGMRAPGHPRRSAGCPLRRPDVAPGPPLRAPQSVRLIAPQVTRCPFPSCSHDSVPLPAGLTPPSPPRYPAL